MNCQLQNHNSQILKKNNPTTDETSNKETLQREDKSAVASESATIRLTDSQRMPAIKGPVTQRNEISVAQQVSFAKEQARVLSESVEEVVEEITPIEAQEQPEPAVLEKPAGVPETVKIEKQDFVKETEALESENSVLPEEIVENAEEIQPEAATVEEIFEKIEETTIHNGLLTTETEQDEPVLGETEVTTTVEIAETYDNLLIAIENYEKALVDDTQEVNETEFAYQDFEVFIAEQPTAEVPTSFAEIKEQANEQPLEITIVQVAVLLSEKTEVIEDVPELIEIIEELREVVSLYKENNETYPQLTPEITEKLIRLLQVLGYEEPSEALVQCISAHGYLFLWQAIEHVVDEEKKAELGIQAALLVKDDEDTPSKLASFLFSLIGIPRTESVT